MWTLFWIATGCAGPTPTASAPSSPPAPQTQVAAPTQAPPASPRPSVPEEHIVAVRALSDKLLAAIDQCERLLQPVTAEQALAQPFPFSAAQLHASCGPAFTLYDDAGRAQTGVTRVTNHLISTAARIAEDLRYMERTMTSTGSERANAVNHVVDAFRGARTAVQQLPSRDLNTYHYAPQTDADVRRAMENDAVEIEAAQRFLQNLVYNQGLDPTAVRTRMLEAHGAQLHAELGARERGAREAQNLPAPLRELDAAYIAALRAYVDRYTWTWTTFRDGKVPDDAARQAIIDESQAVHGRWLLAWKSALSSLR